MCDLSRVLYVVPKLGMGQVKPRYNSISLPPIGDKSHKKKVIMARYYLFQERFFLKILFL